MNTILRRIKNTLPIPVVSILRRIFYPLRNRLLFKPYIIKKEMEGVSFDFCIGDRTGRDWYDRKCINNPVWLEMRFIRDHMIEKGDVVLECGGHHGCSAILLSNWVGNNGKIITFEPFPTNCEILQKNINLNKLSNVTLRRNVVGAKRGQITLDAPSSSVSPSGTGLEVEMVILDDFQQPSPTFLKIDVEGFELQVLLGAKKILAKRPKLAIEIHADFLSQYGCSVDEILKVIGIEDYKVWIQWKDDQEPITYNTIPTIDRRVHLFCMPLR